MPLALSRKFDLAMIDPPWPLKLAGGRKERATLPTTLPYSTLDLNGIFEMLDSQIFNHLETPANVFMWTTDDFLFATEKYMEGRQWKRHARIVWDKGNGFPAAFTVRYSHEYLIWYYKSPLIKPTKTMQGKLGTVWREPNREHSRKPEIAYTNLEAMFPTARKLDVFSRCRRNGWTAWGNEVEKFNAD